MGSITGNTPVFSLVPGVLMRVARRRCLRSAHLFFVLPYHCDAGPPFGLQGLVPREHTIIFASTGVPMRVSIRRCLRRVHLFFVLPYHCDAGPPVALQGFAPREHTSIFASTGVPMRVGIRRWLRSAHLFVLFCPNGVKQARRSDFRGSIPGNMPVFSVVPAYCCP